MGYTLRTAYLASFLFAIRFRSWLAGEVANVRGPEKVQVRACVEGEKINGNGKEKIVTERGLE